MHPRPPKPSEEAFAKEGYWLAIEQMWVAVVIHEEPFEYFVTKAPYCDEQTGLLAAHWCVQEVSQGGLHEYFRNPPGVAAPEAVKGLRMVGLTEAAEAVLEGMNRFTPPYPRDRVARLEDTDHLALMARQRPGWDPYAELDRRFLSTAKPEAFEAAATAYVAGHMTLFFE